jgi:hypothetical protein
MASNPRDRWRTALAAARPLLPLLRPLWLLQLLRPLIALLVLSPRGRPLWLLVLGALAPMLLRPLPSPEQLPALVPVLIRAS